MEPNTTNDGTVVVDSLRGSSAQRIVVDLQLDGFSYAGDYPACFDTSGGAECVVPHDDPDQTEWGDLSAVDGPASMTVPLAVTAAAGETASITAVVASYLNDLDNDYDPTNNTVTVTIPVRTADTEPTASASAGGPPATETTPTTETPPTTEAPSAGQVTGADLALVLAGPESPVGPGGIVELVVTVQNLGDIGARGVMVTLDLAGLAPGELRAGCGETDTGLACQVPTDQGVDPAGERTLSASTGPVQIVVSQQVTDTSGDIVSVTGVITGGDVDPTSNTAVYTGEIG